MRVLVLSPMLPYPPVAGGPARVFHLIKELSRRHEITLLAGINYDRERDLVGSLRDYCRVHTTMVPVARRSVWDHIAGLCSPAPYYRFVMCSPAFGARLAKLVGEERFDIVQAEFLATGHFAVSLLGPIRVLDMHNVESTYVWRLLRRKRPGLGSLLTLSDAVKLSRYQQRIVSRFDRCLAVSDVDARQLAGCAPGAAVTVVPNGVDPEFFHPMEAPEDPAGLVFTASFTYAPNVDAMVFFCREVLPQIRAVVPGARLTIAGREPPPEVTALAALGGIEVTGAVPDMRPYLARAAVVVVPLRLGSGTRIKILEAMAMGKAVVSTSAGAEGLDIRPGHDVEIADGVEEFTRRTVDLLGDAARRRCLGDNARQTVMTRYTWPQIAVRLDAVYHEMRPGARAGMPFSSAEALAAPGRSGGEP